MFTLFSNNRRKLLFDILLLLSFITIILTAIPSRVENNEDVIIHVVPHTHDDAGWNWTFDEYYYGTGGSRASVKKILDNFVESLNDRKDRTFIYVEMGFFVRWYKDQSEEVKLRVKDLLVERRFEFINGGYVMHDEAASYYQHSIDQMRLGLMFLKKEFNFVPEIAWFIDPFGHSASNAYILSKMGFKKIAMVRIDNQEKDYRKKNKSLEFYWVPFDKFDNSVKIFTHVTHDHYCLPDGMENFINDDKLEMTDEEVLERSNRIVNDLRNINSKYLHKNALLMYGCDFTHNARDNNYLNLERVMEFINKSENPKYGMKLIYSTPSKYFNTIFEEVNYWPNYEGFDFFPYGDGDFSIWTGYFTSRPYLKGMVRETGNFLIAASNTLFKIILKSKLNKNKSDKFENEMNNGLFGENINSSNNIKSLINGCIDNLFVLREKLAICQHHDAVAGTAKEYVSQDYIKMLEDAVKNAKSSLLELMKESKRKYNGKKLDMCIDPVVDFACMKKILDLNTEKKLILKLKSVKTQSSYEIFKSFYINSNYSVKNRNKHSKFDTFCLEELRNKTADCKIYFKNTKKFELKNRSIQKNLKFLHDSIDKNSLKNKKFFFEKKNLNSTNATIFNISENLHATLAHETNELKFQLNTSRDNNDNLQKIYNFKLSHSYFISYNGENSDLRPNGSCPSGAYILSTTEISPKDFEFFSEKSYYEIGNHFTRIVLKFAQSYISFVIENNPHDGLQNFIELESIYEPITDDAIPREYLLIVSSDISNSVTLPNGTYKPEFWTDSNGIKLMRRIQDFRQSYDYTVTDPVAANFLPVNSMISIRERKNATFVKDEYIGLNPEDKMITLMNDRSQSIGVLKNGQIISIQNRQSYKDDWKGLDQVIHENHSFSTYFRLKNYIVFNNDLKLIRKLEENIQERFYLVSVQGNQAREVEKKIQDFEKNENWRKGKNDEKEKHNDNLKQSIKNLLIETESFNLISNIHILSEDKIFIQLFNNCDKYFEKSCVVRTVNFLKNRRIKYHITEFSFNGTVAMDKLHFSTNTPKIIGFNVKPLDFRLFLIELNDS